MDPSESRNDDKTIDMNTVDKGKGFLLKIRREKQTLNN